MTTTHHAPRARVLFILGNNNHNTMLHQIAQAMPECDAWFTPYYCDDWTVLDLLRRVGALEFVALGHEFRRECIAYCKKHGLRLDIGGKRGPYDLVVTCSDLVVPENVRQSRLVGVQEGMIDPQLFWYRVRERLTFLPRWAAGTACTGLSGYYDRYCLASEGYREDFIRRGAPGHRLVVTGLPNFDDLASFHKPGHWIEGHVLACTSDGRETFRRDDRKAFIEWCVDLAKGRPLVFKFHPNENMKRAIAEVKEWAPGATCVTEGKGEELAANCAVLITEWSTLAFTGIVRGIETHSYRDMDEMRSLVPLQHKRGAQNIAQVCRDLLDQGARPAWLRGVA